MKFSEIKYNRPNFDVLFKQLDDKISSFKSALDAEGQFLIYREFTALMHSYDTQFALARIRNFQNTNDEYYKEEHLAFSNTNPLINKRYKALNELLLNSPFLNELTKLIGRNSIESKRIFQTTFSDSVIEEQKEEKQLTLKYINLISGLSVEWDDKKIPLSMLAVKKEDVNQEVRHRAFIAEGECYNTIKDQLEETFDLLVKNRTRQAKKLGFKNFVELGYARMSRNCYRSNDIKVFRKQVQKEIVPVVSRILEKRRERLGLPKLYFYDLSLSHPEGSPKPQVNSDLLIGLAKKMYSEMSPQTSEFINLMINNELFDLHSRLGKAPGGFCSFIQDYDYPFIFSNFNGTASDVNVMTHEAGHAFAHYIKSNGEKKYYNATMDVSEVCSMSMEFLTMPWHSLFFKDKTEKFHEKQLEDALIFLPYACQVDEFQQYIYENPDLTHAQRNEAWLLIEKTYRPNIDYNGIAFYGTGCGWQRQTHIYKTPFYYIDYALAQVVALSFYEIHLKDRKKAFELYMQFLGNINDLTFTELIDSLGFHSPLKPGTLRCLMSSLKQTSLR